jgi:tripartite-type tricarboxylate transporter receptor subunit TctC
MSRLSRRTLIAAPLLTALPAMAQTYPAKSVRWIVPYAAGGPADALVRAIAPKLSEGLGVPVIVDNRGGAGGSLAMEQLIKLPPDGSAIVLGGTGTHSLNPYIQANIQYDPIKDFAAVTPIVSYVNVLVVNAEVPVKSVAELVAYAKANPNKVTFASGGTGTSNHLAAELLKSVTGAPMVHVPYRGSGPGMIDVIAGHITCMFDILVTALPQIRAGRQREVGQGREGRRPQAGVTAARIACHTRSGEQGMSMWLTPSSASASTTAFTITPSAGVMPPSPPPRKPSGWVVEGTSESAVANDGKSSARGMA